MLGKIAKWYVWVVVILILAGMVTVLGWVLVDVTGWVGLVILLVILSLPVAVHLMEM